MFDHQTFKVYSRSWVHYSCSRRRAAVRLFYYIHRANGIKFMNHEGIEPGTSLPWVVCLNHSTKALTFFYLLFIEHNNNFEVNNSWKLFNTLHLRYTHAGLWKILQKRIWVPIQIREEKRHSYLGQDPLFSGSWSSEDPIQLLLCICTAQFLKFRKNIKYLKLTF